MTQTVPDISPLMPMHQDPLLVQLLFPGNEVQLCPFDLMMKIDGRIVLCSVIFLVWIYWSSYKIVVVLWMCIIQQQHYLSRIDHSWSCNEVAVFLSCVSVRVYADNFVTSVDGAKPNQHPSFSLLTCYLNGNEWKTGIVEGDLSQQIPSLNSRSICETFRFDCSC